MFSLFLFIMSLLYYCIRFIIICICRLVLFDLSCVCFCWMSLGTVENEGSASTWFSEDSNKINDEECVCWHGALNLPLGAVTVSPDSTGLKYSKPSDTSGSRLLLVCDVALGRCREVTKKDPRLTQAPDTYHSVQGLRHTPATRSEFEVRAFIFLRWNYSQPILKRQYIFFFICSCVPRLSFRVPRGATHIPIRQPPPPFSLLTLALTCVFVHLGIINST